MQNSDISDPLFKEAVNSIDSGDQPVLRGLVEANPRLVREPLDLPEAGYFQHPYLIWFVADNPIRNSALPANIVEVTRTLIDYVHQYAQETSEHQINYTLGLVATGRIPKECGVQLELIDLLIDAGARPGGVIGAIAHDNPDAAAHLVRRGAELTFAAAVGLGWEEDVKRLGATASPDEWDLALMVAAFRGNADLMRYLLRGGASATKIPPDCQGFQSHATALHQAVSSGSLESVKLLVDSGADPDVRDLVYEGTPLDWAEYLQRDAGVGDEMKQKYREIEAYLRSAG